MKKHAASLALLLAASIALLTACGGGSSSDAGTETTPTPHSLGLMKLTVSGLGSGQISSHAELAGAGGVAPRALTELAQGIDIQQASASTVDIGTNATAGTRHNSSLAVESIERRKVFLHAGIAPLT